MGEIRIMPATKVLVQEIIAKNPSIRQIDLAAQLGVSKQQINNIFRDLGLTRAPSKKPDSLSQRKNPAPLKKRVASVPTDEKCTAKLNKFVSQQVIAEVKAEVQEEIQQRCLITTTELADKMFSKIQDTIDQISDTLKDGPNGEEPNAGWLRSASAALDTLVKNYLLLTGKPTSRQAINVRDDSDEKSDPVADLRESLSEVRQAIGIKPQLRAIAGGKGDSPST
jgi:hypothetical protein